MRGRILGVLVFAGLALLVAATGAVTAADPGHHEVQITNGSGDVNASYYYDSSAGSINVTEDGGSSWTNSTLSNPNKSALAIDWATGNISAVNDTILVGPGTYNGSVTVPGPVTLEATEGPSRTTLTPVPGGTEVVGFHLVGNSAVVRNFTVTGYDSSSNVAIDVDSPNVTVADNVVEKNLVGIDDAGRSNRESSYLDNTVIDNLASGIQIEANQTTLRGNRVENNSGHGIVLRDSGDSLLWENDVRSNDLDGVHVNNSANNTIESNEIFDNGGYSNFGVRIANGSDLNRVIDSTIVPNEETGSAGVIVDDSNSAVVRNNSIRGGTGVEVSDSARGALVAENAITAGDDMRGIDHFGNHSVIRNNTIQKGSIGINVEARNVTISGNNVSDGTVGLVLVGSVHGVAGNLVTNSSGGFTIDSVTNSSFVGNSVSHNDYGIRLLDATNNSFDRTVVNDVQQRGIELILRGGRTASSHGNVFENVTVRRSGSTAFYAEGVTGPPNVLTNLDVGASTNAGTTVDAEAKNVSINAVGASPGSPSGLDSVGRLVDVTNTSAPADSVNLTLHYEESDLDNFDDATLALYNYTGSWTEVSGAAHDTSNNAFSGTFTDYDVIGLYAESTSTSGGGGGYFPPPSDGGTVDDGSSNDATDGNTTDDSPDDADGGSAGDGTETGDDGDTDDGTTGAEGDEESDGSPSDESSPSIDEAGSGSFPWWLLLLLLALIGGVSYYYREDIQERVEEYRD